MSMDEVTKSMSEEKDACQMENLRPGPIIRTTGPGEPLPKDPWIHRSEGMLCKTCMFYVAKLSTPLKLGPITGIGRCRRHAPTMSGYPVVFPTDWCGDHKVDENKFN